MAISKHKHLIVYFEYRVCIGVFLFLCSILFDFFVLYFFILLCCLVT